ncbi:MAG: hypothetical protein ACK5LJ_03045 [Paracoccus sp. (in: a-proteobacteria)]
MAKIAPLDPAEDVRLDPRYVQHIVNEMGNAAAGGIIGLALEQMMQAVRGLCCDVTSGDMARVTWQAQRLSRLAGQVGLVSLAEVSADMADCARRGDQPALRAVLARARRVADLSQRGLRDRVRVM